MTHTQKTEIEGKRAPPTRFIFTTLEKFDFDAKKAVRESFLVSNNQNILQNYMRSKRLQKRNIAAKNENKYFPLQVKYQEISAKYKGTHAYFTIYYSFIAHIIILAIIITNQIQNV